MKYLRIASDYSKRALVKKSELKKNLFFLLNNKFYNFLFFYWKGIEHKLVSRVSVNNYCILSGRARGVFRCFKLSRILLRKIGAKGFLSGLKKKNW